MQKISTPFEAYVVAMRLAMTAPGYEKRRECLDLANDFSGHLFGDDFKEANKLIADLKNEMTFTSVDFKRDKNGL